MSQPTREHRRKPAQHRVCGGIFTPDPDMPPDPISGELTCRCRLKGKPGDAHHTLPAVVEDARSRAAGETYEGD